MEFRWLNEQNICSLLAIRYYNSDSSRETKLMLRQPRSNYHINKCLNVNFDGEQVGPEWEIRSGYFSGAIQS